MDPMANYKVTRLSSGYPGKFTAFLNSSRSTSTTKQANRISLPVREPVAQLDVYVDLSSRQRSNVVHAGSLLKMRRIPEYHVIGCQLSIVRMLRYPLGGS
jgi:hypothetical protein